MAASFVTLMRAKYESPDVENEEGSEIMILAKHRPQVN